MTKLCKCDFILVYGVEFQTLLVKRKLEIFRSIELTNSASSVSMEHETYSDAEDRLFFHAVLQLTANRKK